MIGPKDLEDMLGPLPERWRQDIQPEEAKDAVDQEASRELATKDVTIFSSLGTFGNSRMFVFLRNEADILNPFSAEEWTPSFKWTARQLMGSSVKVWKDNIIVPAKQIIKVFCGGTVLGMPNCAKYFMAGNQYPKISIQHPAQPGFEVTGCLKEVTQDEADLYSLPSIRKSRGGFEMSIREAP